MKTKLAAFFASVCAATYAGAATTVTVDTVESPDYTASSYINPASTSPEVHVIGIYEAYTSDSPRNDALGTAVVNVTGSSDTPIDLVLSAYEPTQWVLQGAGVQNIHSVLINGYFAGSVSGIDAAKVIDKSGPGQSLGTFPYAWPSAPGGSNTQALLNAVEAIYNTPVSTFTGAYGATAFTVALSAVPEMSSIGLMAIGLAAVAGASRARRR
jgi:hypothetical protein